MFDSCCGNACFMFSAILQLPWFAVVRLLFAAALCHQPAPLSPTYALLFREICRNVGAAAPLQAVTCYPRAPALPPVLLRCTYTQSTTMNPSVCKCLLQLSRYHVHAAATASTTHARPSIALPRTSTSTASSPPAPAAPLCAAPTTRTLHKLSPQHRTLQLLPVRPSTAGTRSRSLSSAALAETDATACPCPTARALTIMRVPCNSSLRRCPLQLAQLEQAHGDAPVAQQRQPRG